ncbi:OprD family porin [Vibrio sp. SM6]|uniref:OprD family porin n=1 Tax=Vibrio agarilyticus TaxID=2726741 RepID=A0A7X8YG24_9VIBR|nr:OprD family porin [Vibrio agarilyticus]NLS12503.1 OprD family porin [Vibrio agarilyticus]
MKRTTLSSLLLLALAPASASFAADAQPTFAEAVAGSSLFGSAKAFYWDRSSPRGEASLLTTGLSLGLKTQAFYGVQLEAGFQTSSSPFASDKAKFVFANDQYGSGSVLSLMNLSYRHGDSELKLGRMHMDMTLVATSYSRAVQEAFEAATVSSQWGDNLQWKLAYINKYQDRVDYQGNIGQFEKFNKDGAISLDVTLQPISDMTIKAAYLDQLDIATTALLQATYQYQDWDFGAQYYGSEREGKEWIAAQALKMGVQTGKAHWHVAYSTTGDGDSDIVFGLGAGSDRIYAGSLAWSPNYVANTDVYQIGADYAFSPQWYALASYTYAEDPTHTYDYWCALVQYRFEGALQGLSATALTDIEGQDGDKNELRFNIAYRF